MLFLCFSSGFPHLPVERSLCRPLPLGRRRRGVWPCPAWFSYAFPVLFLRFCSLPGGKVPEPRSATPGTGRCVMGSPPSFPMVFMCFSLGFTPFPVERYLSRPLPLAAVWRCLTGSPPSFPMVFLCFSLGFAHFPVERYLSRPLPLAAVW